MKKAIETCAIALHDFGEGFWWRLTKVQAEHAAERLRAERHSRLARFGAQSVRKGGARRGDSLQQPRLHHELQRGETRRNGERIARERAGLVDRPERRELLHDVATAAERAERQAAADHLAERRQVRANAVMRLCAAKRD